MAKQNEFKGFTAIERFRLYLGSELSWLAGRIIPKVDFDKDGCQDPPEWVIYDRDPYNFTYSCTFHLSEMVSVDTVRIEPYVAASTPEQKTCCYVSSGDDWIEVPGMEEVG